MSFSFDRSGERSIRAPLDTPQQFRQALSARLVHHPHMRHAACKIRPEILAPFAILRRCAMSQAIRQCRLQGVEVLARDVGVLIDDDAGHALARAGACWRA